MPGRLSALHNTSGLTQGVSIPPASRNGDTTNVVNGTTIDLHGMRGVYFILTVGVLTGAANVAAHLQENDTPLDPANGTWANVAGETIAVTTVANSAHELGYAIPDGGEPVIRIVQVVDANAALSSIAHFTY